MFKHCSISESDSDSCCCLIRDSDFALLIWSALFVPSWWIAIFILQRNLTGQNINKMELDWVGQLDLQTTSNKSKQLRLTETHGRSSPWNPIMNPTTFSSAAHGWLEAITSASVAPVLPLKGIFLEICWLWCLATVEHQAAARHDVHKPQRTIALGSVQACIWEQSGRWATCFYPSPRLLSQQRRFHKNNVDCFSLPI